MLGGRSDRTRLQPLYLALVEIGRDPAWYRQGQVPDTLNGRFDMMAVIMTLLLLRLERDGSPEARTASTLVTELFVDDMDGSLRQIGIADHVVGKHMGRMMGALGGRLTAFRPSYGDTEAMSAAVNRNIFHEAAPSPEAVKYVSERFARLAAALDATLLPDLLAGAVPRP
jgi:cytochrome b pre-mRNA-processing protein 3